MRRWLRESDELVKRGHLYAPDWLPDVLLRERGALPDEYPTLGNTRGDAFLRTQAEYEGVITPGMVWRSVRREDA